METKGTTLHTSIRYPLCILVGLVACAAPVHQAESRPLAANNSNYSVEVLMHGSPARTFSYQGETFVLGAMGEHYTLRVFNHSGRRVEAVVSVDGRDVVDGKPGDFRNKRGYLIPAYGSVDIDGWRLSRSHAAAFRFSSVANSYAARMGNAREVGVIGVAIFPERIVRRPIPRPVYPCCRDRYDEDSSPMESRSAAPSMESAPRAEAKARRSTDSMGGAPTPSRRPGLGTEFGERVHSRIEEVSFIRQSQNSPAAILGIRYNDRQGLIALGIDVDGYGYRDDDSYLRRTADPFPSSSRRYARPPEGWRNY